MAKPKPKIKDTPEEKLFDFIMHFFAFTTPLFELPQVWLIYSRQSASDVSWITWVYFCIADLVFLTYSLKHRIKPLIIAYSLYLIIEIIIVIGIFRYK